MRLTGVENSKSSTHSFSQSPSQIAPEQPTQQLEKSISKSKLDVIRSKSYSKLFISSLTKEEREHSIRQILKEVQTEEICKSQSCNKRHTIRSVATDHSADCTSDNFKKLLSTTEIRNFFKKREMFMVVYGSSKLLLNPMVVQCPVCRNLVSIGHINNIIVGNDKLIKHIKKTHMDDKTSSEHRGKLVKKLC